MKLKLKTVLMSVKAEVSLQGKHRGTLDILHSLKKESGSETFLFCSRLVSIVFLFNLPHQNSDRGNRPFVSGERFSKRCVLVSVFFLIRVISVDGRLIPRKKTDAFFKEP